ncbi:MAG: gamma-glutamylcyclotransferase family protein [Anaerolineae bacterium]
MKQIPLFVYGTLLDISVQRALLGRTIEGTPDRLADYVMNYMLLPPYPVAIPAEGHYIIGQVLTIKHDELRRLDQYEGECYQRIEITLESGQRAWVYVGHPDCYDIVPSQDGS